MSKKDTYHHHDLKTSLIREALNFLKKNPASQLSLRELARKLKVSHMAPYRHFKTKEDLIAEIIEKGFQALTLKFDEAKTQANGDFQQIMNLFGKVYIRFCLENPEQVRLMFSGLLCDPEQYLSTHQAGQVAFSRLLELIKWGQENGHLRPNDDPYLLSLMIWSSVHGSAMLMLENQFAMIDNAPEVQVEKYVDFMSERMINGLKAHS